MAEIWNVEDKRHALDALNTFEAAYGAKFGKAVAKITDDFGQLGPSTTSQPSIGCT